MPIRFKKFRFMKFIYFKILRPIILKSAWILSQPFERMALRIGYAIMLSKFVKQNRIISFREREGFYEYILSKEKLNDEIEYLEFGVSKGCSLRWWLDNVTNPKANFIGFDTFTGIPENYGILPKGSMSNSGRPPLITDPRCSFQVGLFQDTLPGFIKSFRLRRRKVINIDCDLYSSTIFVLTALAPFLSVGDLIIFDDFGSLSCAEHEFRAFNDFFSSYRIKYELVASGSNYIQIAIKLKSVNTENNSSSLYV